jgi:flagellar protein FlgJ
MKLAPEEFIAKIAPIACKLRCEGSPIFPSVRIAQAAHETGWTIHPWNNLVGYKVGSGKPNAYWKGQCVSTKTWEVYDGVRYDNVQAVWRAYDTLEDGFRDQDLLFGISRYDRVRAAASPEEQAYALFVCGYATDPKYAEKIISLIQRYGLRQYDRLAEEEEEAMREEIEQLRRQVEQMKGLMAMDIPDWAKPAVDAAVKAGLVTEPNGGSYDFYRILVVMHRKGLF